MSAAAETRAEALARLAARLAEAAIEEPRREARILLSRALDLDLAELLAHPDQPVGEGAVRLAQWLERRLAGEPLSRLGGGREFFGRFFQTSPAVLDPRPETEILVALALAHLSGCAAPRILDLGTGSGAILLSLLAERPDATGLGVDLSSEALAIAAGNASRLGLAGRVEWCSGDLFAGVTGRFDLVVSNPPYIPSDTIAGLDREVRDHDPHLALDGGPDGLDFYRRIARDAPGFLKSGGVLALEMGQGQSAAVVAMVEAAGFSALRLHRDLAGIERHLSAVWMPEGS